jgi:hypothetical protein
MKLETLCQFFVILSAVGVLASCGSSKTNEIRGGGQHICSEARAKQTGLTDFMNKKKYNTDYAAMKKCPYDYQEINDAYHEGYIKGKAAMK